MDRNLQRETMLADGAAKQLEKEANGVIHSVDTSGMEVAEDAKINKMHTRMEVSAHHSRSVPLNTLLI